VYSSGYTIFIAVSGVQIVQVRRTNWDVINYSRKVLGGRAGKDWSCFIMPHSAIKCISLQIEDKDLLKRERKFMSATQLNL